VSSRIQQLQSPFQKWRRKIWGVVKGPLDRFSPNQRFWIGFALLCLITTLLIQNPIWESAGANFYKEGDIAREAIYASADIYLVDEAKTDQERGAVRANINPIFLY
jgi:hypothetical protein